MNGWLDALFVWPVSVNVFLVIGAWLYYVNRRPEMQKHPGEGKIYHCKKCGMVYVERRLYPVLECPRCQHPNAAVRR
jgi:hypothetical protein